MPMIIFKCNNPDCDNEIMKVFTKIKDMPPFLDCGQCGTGKMERQLSAPSTRTTEVIDNGLMAKRVEISKEIIEQERTKLENEGK